MSIFNNEMIGLSIVMVLCGIVGGYCNFLLTTNTTTATGTSYNNSPKRDRVLTSMISGVIASFCVPLFLNLLSSDLLSNTYVSSTSNTNNADNGDVFVFIGFCLLAATFSTGFISNLSTRMIKQLQSKFENLESMAAPIIKNQMEPETPVVADNGTELDNMLTNEDKIVGMFTDSKYTYRSLNGLERELAIPLQELTAGLDALVKEGRLSLHQTEKGVRYYITDKGRSKS